MSYETRLEEFRDLIRRIEYLKYTLNSLIYWDKITYMPPDGIEYRSQVMSFLADEQYKLMSGPAFRGHVKYFTGHRKNDELTNAMMKRITRSSGFISRIPEEEYRRYIELIARSEQVWEKAREEDDFESFRPYLENIMETFRKFAEYWGYENDPYDALLGYYEEGLTVEKVDSLVQELKPFLIALLDQVREAEKDRPHCRLTMPPADRKQQEQLWKEILSDLGFSFTAGRVDTGAHPTILASSPSDVRIVNAYRPEDLRYGLFNVLHSGGKGIYQQSIDPALLGTFLAEVPSFAMEECVGRFYEDILGRSLGFWSHFFDKIRKAVPDFSVGTPRDLYEDVNRVSTSTIRLEADQLTYLLHIIIRYELERELINGRLAVSDLPQAWNQKYEDYLGIRPENDREGVLQDIHWAAGYVGYFPTYIVADLTAAQLAASIEKECGSLESLMETGNFAAITDWLRANIFCSGARYTAEELTLRATGEPLTSGYYMDYLRKKFSEVYNLTKENEKEKSNE